MTYEREKILMAFSSVGNSLLSIGWAQSYELVNAHDIHGFYRINDDLAVHVQGYPRMSRENEMFVSMRLRDYKKMMDIRARGEVSIGNEHEANLSTLSDWNSGKYIPCIGSDLTVAINREAVKYSLTH